MPVSDVVDAWVYRQSVGMSTEDQAEALERIETRVSAADRTRIGAAAGARHESIARFVQRAALKEADEVLGREVDVTRTPVDQFEGLLAALDRPVELIPEVVQLAASERAFTRRSWGSCPRLCLTTTALPAHMDDGSSRAPKQRTSCAWYLS